MSSAIFLDEIHLSFETPPTLPVKDQDKARRTLNSRAFRKDLRKSIQAVLRRYPALRKVRWTIAS